MIQPLWSQYHGIKIPYIHGMFQSKPHIRRRRRSSVSQLLPKKSRFQPTRADNKVASLAKCGPEQWTDEKNTEQLDIGISHPSNVQSNIYTIPLPRRSPRNGSIRPFRRQHHPAVFLAGEWLCFRCGVERSICSSSGRDKVKRSSLTCMLCNEERKLTVAIVAD